MRCKVPICATRGQGAGGNTTRLSPRARGKGNFTSIGLPKKSIVVEVCTFPFSGVNHFMTVSSVQIKYSNLCYSQLSLDNVISLRTTNNNFDSVRLAKWHQSPLPPYFSNPRLLLRSLHPRVFANFS
jgi:hypothetical protein